MERRLTESNPDYPEMDRLARLICVLKNPHMVLGMEMDIDEYERRSILSTILAEQKDLIENGDVRDAVNSLLGGLEDL